MTHHPTAEWTAQQITEAFPGDVPRFLHRDRDSIYGDVVKRRVATMGFAENEIWVPDADPIVVLGLRIRISL